jgi:hypothetical protein
MPMPPRPRVWASEGHILTVNVRVHHAPVAAEAQQSRLVKAHKRDQAPLFIRSIAAFCLLKAWEVNGIYVVAICI